MKKPFLRNAGKAAGDTINLVVAGASAVAAAALHSWPVVAIGAATYAAMVAWDMAKAAAEPPEKQRPELPDPARIEDEETRTLAAALIAARAELDRALQESSADVVAMLAVTIGGIEELVRLCAGLIAQAAELSKYLAKVDRRALELELAQLAAKIETTADDAARAEYEETRAARDDQLRAVEDLTRARERALAQLGRARATMEGLPAKMLRMRTLDREALDRFSGDLGQEIERVNADVRTFEETIRVMMEGGLGT